MRMIPRWMKNCCSCRCSTPTTIVIVSFAISAMYIITSTLSDSMDHAKKSKVALERDAILRPDRDVTPIVAKESHREFENGKKVVIYKDFSHCPPRPTYLKEYNTHCWAECKNGITCSKEDGYNDIKAGRAVRRCFPNLHLIGIRKCGTTDMTKWFTSHRSVQNTLQDYPPSDKCPVEFMAIRQSPHPKLGDHAFNDGPGALVEVRELASNDTHLEVVSPMQLLGYMTTTNTRFYVQLRNPTDRAISYLFHWRKRHYILKETSLAEFTESVVHQIITELIASFQDCVATEGELACVYKYAGKGTDRHVSRVKENLLRHSLYVIYIEESLKFVPRQQIKFVTMNEYSKDQIGMVKSVMSFFGLQFQKSSLDLQEEVKNIGKKKPVWNETIEILDEFYEPYNQRLAKLLGDDKWLFKRET